MFPKRLFITIASGAIIITGSLLAIQFAKGYRPSRSDIVQGTGLLAANSFPNGAQLSINGKLTSATDTTINLSPGNYEIEIKKDGYQAWRKTLHIEKELVTQTNATLFPSASSLSPLTLTGVTNVVPSPDGQRLVFLVASASSELKNGLYVLELTDSLLSLQRGAKQIVQAPLPSALQTLQNTTFVWSPDSSQLLLADGTRNWLIDTYTNTSWSQLQDVSYKKEQLIQEWKAEFLKKQRTRLQKFPLQIQAIATQSATRAYISPDDFMVMYTPQTSSTLPIHLIPAIQASSTQLEHRNLVAGNTYVYDLREDRNFLIQTGQAVAPNPAPVEKKKGQKVQNVPNTITPTPEFSIALQELRSLYSPIHNQQWQWFPDSRHVLGLENNSIVIKEYDGTNQTIVYSGPMVNSWIYPWPNGSKVILQVQFSSDSSAWPNLYALSMK